MAALEGILLCNKPSGISSHDMVDFLRKTIGQRRIGHTGTLDPLASGLLVVCLERATKIVQFLSDTDKEYRAQIRLGKRSTTYDAEGVIDEPESPDLNKFTKNQVEGVLSGFEGRSRQKVPAYSAVKVNGKRLYKMTRKGIEVETPSREINIEEITLTKMAIPYIELNISCAKGTYIRALANDIGERLGCGAYLSNLHRIRVGSFRVENAFSKEDIVEYFREGSLGKYIIPIESSLAFPSIKVSRKFEPVIITGKVPALSDIDKITGQFKPNDLISLLGSDGKIMAIGKSTVGSNELSEYAGKSFFKYVRILN